MTRAIEWNLSDEAHQYLAGGGQLQLADPFSESVMRQWAEVEQPEVVALLDLRDQHEQWQQSPSASGLAELVDQARPLQLGCDLDSIAGAADQGSEDVVELSNAASPLGEAIETTHLEWWGVFVGRVEDYRVANAGTGEAVGTTPEEAYQWVIDQLTAEDPSFPQRLEEQPELQQQLWEETWRRFATEATTAS